MAVRPHYQRRHYVQFAAIIKRMNANTTCDIFSASYVREFANHLADTFERDNSRFNRMRFLAACGLTTGR